MFRAARRACVVSISARMRALIAARRDEVGDIRCWVTLWVPGILLLPPPVAVALFFVLSCFLREELELLPGPFWREAGLPLEGGPGPDPAEGRLLESLIEARE